MFGCLMALPHRSLLAPSLEVAQDRWRPSSGSSFRLRRHPLTKVQTLVFSGQGGGVPARSPATAHIGTAGLGASSQFLPGGVQHQPRHHACCQGARMTEG